MSYFVILGKTPQLSLEELQLIGPTNIHRKGRIVIFDFEDSSFYKKLEQGCASISQLGGIIKWGKIVKLGDENFVKILKGLSLVGVNERKLGMVLKKQYGVKRFKEIELEKSDLEIKNEGKEFINLDEFSQDMIGVVSKWQDIKRFEIIDFEKPSRGMKIGMMPGKLTQMLVNIGVVNISSILLRKKNITIYDPFCGFGTTGFIANSLGYNFIGSDINITPAKQNKKRWMETEYAQKNKYFTLFKHDVSDEFTKYFLQQVDIIVSEGRLGPLLQEKNHFNKEQQYKKMMNNIKFIVEVYTIFLKNIKIFFIGVPIIITVPVYLTLPSSFIEERITEVARKMGYIVEQIGEIYKREKQNIGRRVLKMKILNN